MSSKKIAQEKCSKCIKIPSDKKLSVTCDCCKSLLCGDCHGLSPTEVRVLELKTVARVMTFLCGNCKSTMVQVPNILKKLEELTGEVKELRMRQSMLATESAIQEIEERVSRANNIIIYNVPECPSDLAAERIQHDKNECEKIVLGVTDTVACDGIKVFRLGAKDQAATIPRPLKVIMRKKSDAIEVLKNKYKLADPRNVKSDLTPMQREYLKYLRDELDKRINGGEHDLTIKYIQGRPKIVKKSSQKNL